MAAVRTRLRQIRTSLLKAETLATKIEMKCEKKSAESCGGELEELTRRLRRLRQMLRDVKNMRSVIQDQETMDEVRVLVTRFDQCVGAVDLAVLDSTAREEERVCGHSSEDERKEVIISGQKVTVPMTKNMKKALERSKKMDSLRKDVGDLLQVFQDVKELVVHDQEDVSRIEEHVSEAKENVIRAEKETSRAVRFHHHAVGWGVAGAVLGGALGGPLGLCVGSKFGASLGLAVGSATGAMSALGLRRGIRENHEKVAEEAEALVRPSSPKSL